MSYSTPATAFTGDVIPAAFWNVNGRDNIIWEHDRIAGLLAGTIVNLQAADTAGNGLQTKDSAATHWADLRSTPAGLAIVENDAGYIFSISGTGDTSVPGGQMAQTNGTKIFPEETLYTNDLIAERANANPFIVWQLPGFVNGGIYEISVGGIDFKYTGGSTHYQKNRLTSNGGANVLVDCFTGWGDNSSSHWADGFDYIGPVVGTTVEVMAWMQGDGPASWVFVDAITGYPDWTSAAQGRRSSFFKARRVG